MIINCRGRCFNHFINTDVLATVFLHLKSPDPEYNLKVPETFVKLRGFLQIPC